MSLKMWLLSVLTIASGKIIAQKQATIWYFGSYAGVTFASGSPVSLSNSSMDQYEGCATICDSRGKLLFYTNGVTVWDSTHNAMSNGTGLQGHWSSSQSSIAIPKPGSSSIYYIFTTDAQENGGCKNGLQYSEVNMTQNSGKGAVTSNKNIKLAAYTSEKLTAVKHANGTDYWILTYKASTDTILAYQVTSSGVNTTAVKSNIQHSTTTAWGYMKLSPNGNSIAMANGSDSLLLGSFDNSNGKVSKVMGIDKSGAAYGIEFSPKGKYLYYGDYFGTKIYQFDLQSGVRSTIIGSKTAIASSLSSATIGALQIGPDHKIYVSLCFQTALSVINYPDSPGTKCNFVKNAVSLSNECRLGLPTFIQSFFNANKFDYTRNCTRDTTFFELQNKNVDSVKWDFGDNASGANNYSKKVNNAYHRYAKTGSYLVTLISFFSTNKDTAKQYIYISDSKPDLGKDTAQCGTFLLVKLKPQKNFVTYKWSTGKTTSTISVTNKGSYILTTLDTTGCTSSDTMVVMNPRIHASFKLSDTIACQKTPFKLTNTTTYTEDVWKRSVYVFPDNSTIVDSTAYKVFNKVDSFVIKLKAYSKLGCVDSTTRMVKTLPNASIGFSIDKDRQCLRNNNFNFSNTSSIAKGNIVSYFWVLGDDSTSTSTDVINKSYARPDTFRVSLSTITDKGCKDTLSRQVFVFPHPKAQFTDATPEQCFNNNHSDFINQSTITTGSYTNIWDLGDATSSNVTNVLGKHYSIPDTFKVTLKTISTVGCRDSIEKLHIIHPNTNIGFIINKDTQCFEWHKFILSNSSSITEGNIGYNWDFGDGGKSVAKDTNHIYALYGHYNIRLVTTSSHGCKDTLFRRVVLNASPVANFNIDRDRQCYRNNVFNFAGSSSINHGNIVASNWEMGDGRKFTTGNVNGLSYTSEDTFMIALEAVSDMGCKDTIKKMAVTYAQPVVKYIVPNDSQCWQHNYFSINNQTKLKYGQLTNHWDFGDATYDSEFQPSTKKYANSSAQYIIFYKAISEHGCSDSAYHHITLLERPLANFLINDSVQCFKSHLFKFSNTSTFSVMNTLTYFWDYGNGSKSTGQNATDMQYANAVYYKVLLVAYSSLTNCYDTMIKPVLPAPHAQPAFTTDKDSQCLRSNNFSFTNQSSLTIGTMSFKWDFGDGTNSSLKSPVKHYLSGTSYNVKLVTTTNYGCSDSINKTIVLVPHPKASFTVNDSAQCLNQHAFDLNNASSIGYGNYSSHWLFDDATDDNKKDVAGKQFVIPGYHLATLCVNSNFGCTDTVSRVLYLEKSGSTEINILGKDSQCLAGNLFNFNGSSNSIKVNFVSYDWDFADGNTSITNGTKHHYINEGKYKVRLATVSANGCRDTGYVPILIFPTPVSAFKVNSPCFPEAAIFTNQSTITQGQISSFQWDFGDNSGSSMTDPVKYYASEGKYNVRLISTSANGCSDTTVVSQAVWVRNSPKAGFTYERLESGLFEKTRVGFKNVSSPDANSYLWDFGNGNSSKEKDPVVDYDDTARKRVTLYVSNSDNCRDTFSLVTGSLIPDFFFFLPNAFNPESSHGNNIFKPVTSHYVFRYTLEIFNRWGEKVFATNDINQGWDGTYMGEDCQQGVYLCRIYVVPLWGQLQHRELTVTLLR